MSKRLILILALAFVVGIAFAAYAEVQNVKISGDLTVTGIGRDNTDLAKERHIPRVAGLEGEDILTKSDKQKNALSQVRVRIDVDLTDNVTAVVRLINERVWGGEDDSGGTTTGTGGNVANNGRIDLDLAYATMKEFLYSPLSLTIGRQEIHLGNDLIVGDPDTNGWSSTASGIPYYERDLSLRKSFDAVRATLNYDPLVIDGIWSKISEDNVALNEDTTLMGLNANYALNKQTTLEGYFFSKVKGTNNAANPTTNANLTINMNKSDKVYTLGGRVHNTTIKNLSAGVEAAYQWGTYNPKFDYNADNSNQNGTAPRSAWAMEFISRYDLKDVPLLSKYIAKYSPSVGITYAYLSGENPKSKTDKKTYHGWDSMYENQTLGHLINAILGFTNAQLIAANAKMKPMEDLTLSVDYVYALLNKRYSDNNEIGITDTNNVINFKNGATGSNNYYMTNKKVLGNEVDVTLTYDYTEDVQFGLLGGVFLPGDAFRKVVNGTNDHGNHSAATELLGSMKVTF